MQQPETTIRVVPRLMMWHTRLTHLFVIDQAISVRVDCRLGSHHGCGHESRVGILLLARRNVQNQPTT